MLEAGPALQEVAEEQRVTVLEPVQRLREVVLERAAQAVGDAGLVANEIAPLLDQRGQGSHWRALRFKRLQLLWVAYQQLERDLGIAGVILGAAGNECLTILSQHGWIHGKQHQELIALQRMHQRAFGHFQANGNRPTEALIQRSGPLLDRLRAVSHYALLALLRAGTLQTEVVLLIGPIYPDQRRE